MGKLQSHPYSNFLHTICRAVTEKKGEDIVWIDLRAKQEAFADFFVICQASNVQQTKAIAEEIRKEVKKIHDDLPFGIEGLKDGNWVVVDYWNIVVHVMLLSDREHYNLEGLWMDMPLYRIDDMQNTLTFETLNVSA